MDLSCFLADLPHHPSLDNLVVLAAVDSTNSLARRIAGEYLKESSRVPEALVVALEQTAGRGRHGRSWGSPVGQGVYATLMLCPQAAQLPILPLIAGVGLATVLNRYLDVPCGLKWPNDLMVPGGKLGGILIETTLRPDLPPVALVGFGVNYGGDPRLLPPGAAVVAPLCTQPPPLGRLVVELAAEVVASCQRLQEPQAAVAAYQELSLHRPGDVISCRLGEERVESVFRGFDAHGFLRLEREGREIVINTGDLESYRHE